MRILTVTGRAAFLTTARSTRSAFGRSRSMALPSPPETILGAGQPMLTSSAKKRSSQSRSAARPMKSASDPKICSAHRSPGLVSLSCTTSSRSRGVRRYPFAETISVTVPSAPKRVQISR